MNPPADTPLPMPDTAPIAQPDFLFTSPDRQSALDGLVRDLDSDGGVSLLTGVSGTGKTLLCRCLAARLTTTTRVVMPSHTGFTDVEILQEIVAKLDINDSPSAVSGGFRLWFDKLKEGLLTAHRKGRTTLLIIDDAEHLCATNPGLLQLLVELRTDGSKLVHLLLAGLPELRNILATSKLEQRLTGHHQLRPLPARLVRSYLKQRLSSTDRHPDLPFTNAAIRILHRKSQGLPGRLNLLADRAIFKARLAAAMQVSAPMVRRVALELTARRTAPEQYLLGGALAVAIAALVVMTAINPPFPGVREPSRPVPAAMPPPDVGTVSPLADIDASITGQSGGSQDTTEALQGLDAKTALKVLLAAWYAEIAPVSIDDTCTRASNLGLACLEQQRTDWTGIVLLNRPAILAIETGPQQPGYLVVTGIRDRNIIEVHSVAGHHDLPLEHLQAAWTGYSLILWQMPPGYREPASEGDQGQTVAWLRRHLNDMGYRNSPTSAAEIFDTGLTASLKQFQSDYRLPADGIAGPLTWIKSNEATLPGIPTLVPRITSNP